MSDSEPQRFRHPLEDPEPDSEPRHRHPLEAPGRQEQEMNQRQEDLRSGRLVRVVMGNPGNPWLTWTLIGFMVLIFSVSFINFDLHIEFLEAGGVHWASVIRRNEWWRLITSVFLHFDLTHMTMNGLALYSFGQMYEKNAGRVRLLLLFLLSGLAGSVLSLALSPHNSLGAGASGAIFGLGAVELVFLRRHQKYMGAAARSAWMQLLVLLGLQLAIGFTVKGIGNWAHLGGLLMGLAWAWIYGPLYIVPPQIPEKDKDGIGMVRAQDTLPLSRGRLWGVFVLSGVLIVASLLIKLRA